MSGDTPSANAVLSYAPPSARGVRRSKNARLIFLLLILTTPAILSALKIGHVQDAGQLIFFYLLAVGFAWLKVISRRKARQRIVDQDLADRLPQLEHLN